MNKELTPELSATEKATVERFGLDKPVSIPENATPVTVTAADFEVKWDAEHTFPFFEDENADGIYGYGHADNAEFARGVNEYDTVCDPDRDPEDGYTPDDVMHCFAVAYQPANMGPGEWMFTREGVTAETPGAFPMTWLSR